MTTTDKADKVLNMIVQVELSILSLKSDLIKGSKFFNKEELSMKIEKQYKLKTRLFGYYKYVLR